MQRTERNNSRERILQAIKKNKPADISLQEFKSNEKHTIDFPLEFKNQVEFVGGTVWEINQIAELEKKVLEMFPVGTYTIGSNLTEINFANVDLNKIEKGKELENTDLAILKGEIGVAENGAVWLDETMIGHRASPFICQHLLLLLEKSKLVATMNEAYLIMGNTNFPYGVFISGPSKTADIEQSLVIGAHGPKSLIVCLI
jgi:L-lactate dehydrogenase complex protein LldG